MTSGRSVPLVPPLSRAQIEDIADRVLREYFPRYVTNPMPVPVEELFEFILPQYFHVDSGTSNTIPIGAEGVALPRGSRGRPEILLAEPVYDAMHAYDGRARYTGSHECGHGIMHMPYLRSQLIEGSAPALYRRQEIKPFRDPEWQANVFAAAFIMPTEAVQIAVRRVGEDPRVIANAFAVSVSAAEIRLRLMTERGLLD